MNLDLYWAKACEMIDTARTPFERDMINACHGEMPENVAYCVQRIWAHRDNVLRGRCTTPNGGMGETYYDADVIRAALVLHNFKRANGMRVLFGMASAADAQMRARLQAREEARAIPDVFDEQTQRDFELRMAHYLMTATNVSKRFVWEASRREARAQRRIREMKRAERPKLRLPDPEQLAKWIHLPDPTPRPSHYQRPAKTMLHELQEGNFSQGTHVREDREHHICTITGTRGEMSRLREIVDRYVPGVWTIQEVFTDSLAGTLDDIDRAVAGVTARYTLTHDTQSNMSVAGIEFQHMEAIREAVEKVRPVGWAVRYDMATMPQLMQAALKRGGVAHSHIVAFRDVQMVSVDLKDRQLAFDILATHFADVRWTVQGA